MHRATGIFLRAIGQDGRWGSYDMAELDADSLTAWLKRDGGDNALAENCVRVLLGHPQVVANEPSQLPRPGTRSAGLQDSETNLNPDDTAGRGQLDCLVWAFLINLRQNQIILWQNTMM